MSAVVIRAPVRNAQGDVIGDAPVSDAVAPLARRAQQQREEERARREAERQERIARRESLANLRNEWRRQLEHHEQQQNRRMGVASPPLHPLPPPPPPLPQTYPMVLTEADRQREARLQRRQQAEALRAEWRAALVRRERISHNGPAAGGAGTRALPVTVGPPPPPGMAPPPPAPPAAPRAFGVFNGGGGGRVTGGRVFRNPPVAERTYRRPEEIIATTLPPHHHRTSSDDSDEHLLCPICLDVVEDAVQLLCRAKPEECGHVMCSRCCAQLFRSQEEAMSAGRFANEGNRCPCCRAAPVEALPAPVVRRKVKSMQCVCGCGFEGTVSQYMSSHDCAQKRDVSSP